MTTPELTAEEIRLAPEVAAERAGLVYVTDAVPGITRRRRRDRWLYRRPDGGVVTDPEETARIEAIRIPPAWTHVWISPLADGHIQATGRDTRGRKQYRYHPRWREIEDRTKFHRMVPFGHALPGLRERLDQDLEQPGLPREKVLAAVLRLMDETLIRVGNEKYARENQHFGLTTLRHDHARVEGTTITFEFRAKSGKEQRVRLSDPLLASVVHACHELPGQELFCYVDDDGRVAHVGSADVNAYLRAVTQAVFTAKDLRTWGGTRIATETLADLGPPRSATEARKNVLAAFDAAAARLNNTRAVCRASYVAPQVPDTYVSGDLIDVLDRAEEVDRLSHSESAMLLLLA
jgi:DNA topoisomerase-1